MNIRLGFSLGFAVWISATLVSGQEFSIGEAKSHWQRYDLGRVGIHGKIEVALSQSFDGETSEAVDSIWIACRDADQQLAQMLSSRTTDKMAPRGRTDLILVARNGD